MRSLLATLAIFPFAAQAEPPKVMTDIAPVHSLVSQVMGDLGTPDLLLPPGANPHDFSMRPSEARQIQDADVIVWVGHGLTPWLEEPLETLAPNAVSLELIETENWSKLAPRETVGDHEEEGHDDQADPDDHDEYEDHADEHHDDHEDAHAEEEADHDDYGHDDHHAHDHGDTDPHGWLDPTTASAWVDSIASVLAEADPDNASTYAQNATLAKQNLTDLEGRVSTILAGAGDHAYFLPHDGYQYFESRFGLTAAGAIADLSGRDPGPAHIAELRELISAEKIDCVFSDAEVSLDLTKLIVEGTDANTNTIDGIGTGLEPGPDLYEALILRLATSFQDCLAH